MSRTPNLLIWNQTRYHCAMPSLFCVSQLQSSNRDYSLEMELTIKRNARNANVYSLCHEKEYYKAILAAPFRTGVQIMGTPTLRQTLDLSIAMPKESNKDNVCVVSMHKW